MTSLLRRLGGNRKDQTPLHSPAAPGSLWHHRRQFAEDLAARTFTEPFTEPPTEQELRDKHSP